MKAPIVRPAASADIEDAYQWYEAQQTGLGEKFLVAADAVIQSVAANPYQFPVVRRETGAHFFGVFHTGFTTAWLTIRLSSSPVCMLGETHDDGNLATDGQSIA